MLYIHLAHNWIKTFIIRRFYIPVRVTKRQMVQNVTISLSSTALIILCRLGHSVFLIGSGLIGTCNSSRNFSFNSIASRELIFPVFFAEADKNREASRRPQFLLHF